MKCGIEFRIEKKSYTRLCTVPKNQLNSMYGSTTENRVRVREIKHRMMKNDKYIYIRVWLRTFNGPMHSCVGDLIMRQRCLLSNATLFDGNINIRHATRTIANPPHCSLRFDIM